MQLEEDVRRLLYSLIGGVGGAGGMCRGTCGMGRRGLAGAGLWAGGSGMGGYSGGMGIGGGGRGWHECGGGCSGIGVGGAMGMGMGGIGMGRRMLAQPGGMNVDVTNYGLLNLVDSPRYSNRRSRHNALLSTHRHGCYH